jgi:hypothetical protein
MWLTLKKTSKCVILIQRVKCQAAFEDKYWRYFAKIIFMSPKIVVA